MFPPRKSYYGLHFLRQSTQQLWDRLRFAKFGNCTAPLICCNVLISSVFYFLLFAVLFSPCCHSNFPKGAHRVANTTGEVADSSQDTDNLAAEGNQNNPGADAQPASVQKTTHQLDDTVGNVADASGDIVDIPAQANKINPTCDPRAVLRQFCRALVKHEHATDGSNAHKKMGKTCQRIWNFVEGNASQKGLRRVMHMLKFGCKIKSKWKRCDKTGICMHSRHLALLRTKTLLVTRSNTFTHRQDPPWSYRFPKFGRTFPR